MHVHTVLVKLHDPATADECAAAMASMQARIPSMLKLQILRNELDGAYSYDLALTTTWPDLEAYRSYESDPVHLEIREVVLGLMADAATIDYTISA